MARDQLWAGHQEALAALALCDGGSSAVEAVGKLLSCSEGFAAREHLLVHKPGRGVHGFTSAGSRGCRSCGGGGSGTRWGRTGLGRGHGAVCFLGVGAGGTRMVHPNQTGQQHGGGGDGWCFFSLLWMTFRLVLCLFAVCFNNSFLPIAQWFLFSCPNRAVAFITRTNIVACASSFSFVMV